MFLPIIKKLVEAGLSYDDVKRLVKIPSTWGAKISGQRFRERSGVCILQERAAQVTAESCPGHRSRTAP